jgi:hypothetical protein
MPLSLFVVPLFIVFGSRAVGFRRKFVLLGGFPVCVVHGVFPSLLSSARFGPISTVPEGARKG